MLIALHAIAFPIFAIATVAASAVNGLLANATNAMLRTIIPTREYPKAQSLNQGRDSVVSIAGIPARRCAVRGRRRGCRSRSPR